MTRNQREVPDQTQPQPVGWFRLRVVPVLTVVGSILGGGLLIVLVLAADPGGWEQERVKLLETVEAMRASWRAWTVIAVVLIATSTVLVVVDRRRS